MPRVEVKSEVAGTVCKIEAPQGAAVNQGDLIMLIECMKMEIPVNAPHAGIVRFVVAEAETVTERQVLAIIE